MNAADKGGKWIRKEKRRAIYLRDGLRCSYCGRGIEDDIQLTLDHLLPQELGGSNSAENLVTACKSCNSAKGSKSLGKFIVYLENRGVRTEEIRPRIRKQIRRKLKKG